MEDRLKRENNAGKRGAGRIARSVIFAITLVLGLGTAALATAHGPKHDKADKMQKWKSMSEEERQEKLEKRVDRRIEWMTDELELTKDQQAEIRRIMSEKHQRIGELFGEAGEDTDRRQRYREMRKIKKDSRAKIKGVLTDEQVTRVRELREQRRAERPARMTEKLDERLDLDAEQEQQVEAILSEAQDDIHELRREARAKKGETDGKSHWKAHKKQVRKIMKGAADDIESVLTKEQAADFSEIREEFRQHRKRFRKHR